MPRYRRNPDVVERSVDDTVFLVEPDSQAIYHLEAVGAALWRLLENPTEIADAVDLLHQAFPDVARDHIERDVTRVIADLESRGLIADSGAG